MRGKGEIFFQGFFMHGETWLVSRLNVTPRPLCPLDDYKEFGVNCEKMASEIEDHILWGSGESPGSICWVAQAWAQEWWWGQGQRVAGTRTGGSAVPVACRGSPDPG